MSDNQNIVLKVLTSMMLESLRQTKEKYDAIGYVPYFGNGRSRTHKGHIRQIKKRQRKRAHLKSLRR